MRYDVLHFERIRDLRIDRDWTQRRVAEALHIAPNTLSQYEVGLRNIPNEVLIRLAQLYETSVDYLLGLTDQQEPYPKK